MKKNLFSTKKKAVELGHTEAIWQLGRMYEFGIGVDVDEDEAFYYYKKGADVGDAFSIDSLAECYRKGIGTVPDMKK